ncbi:MAG TPA: hypothetical protein VIL20_12760 [Sandaracinaceae bacterium]
MRALALSMAAAALAGCAPTPVDVQLGFPSLDTFLHSDFGRLLVYEVDPQSGLGDCPLLIDAVERRAFGDPVLDSDWQPICAFRNGGVRFADVPPGPHAYVVVARDESNAILLSGCRVAEVYEGAPTVVVELFPTENYVAATSGVTLTCSSEESKCTQGCR